MKRLIQAAIVVAVLVLVAGVAFAAGGRRYRVRLTFLASPAQTVTVGNPCGYGWLPTSHSGPFVPAGDAIESYFHIGCTAVGATGVLGDWKLIQVPVNVFVAPIAKPARPIDCSRYPGFVPTMNNRGCVPPSHPQARR